MYQVKSYLGDVRITLTYAGALKALQKLGGAGSITNRITGNLITLSMNF